MKNFSKWWNNLDNNTKNKILDELKWRKSVINDTITVSSGNIGNREQGFGGEVKMRTKSKSVE